MKQNKIQIVWNMNGERENIEACYILHYAKNYGRDFVCCISVHDRKNARPVFEYSAPGEETTRMTAGEFMYQILNMVVNDGADDETIYEYASNCRVI